MIIISSSIIEATMYIGLVIAMPLGIIITMFVGVSTLSSYYASNIVVVPSLRALLIVSYGESGSPILNTSNPRSSTHVGSCVSLGVVSSQCSMVILPLLVFVEK